MVNLNNEGKRPGYVRLVHPENGSKIYMPNIMMMKDDAAEEFIDVIEVLMSLEDKQKVAKENGEKSAPFDNLKVFLKAAKILKKHYPEYAEFSEDFGIQYHMSAVLSINRNINQKEIKDDIEKGMVDPESVVSEDNPGEDSDSFLSQSQSS